MQANFTVTPSVMKSKASEIRNLNATLKTQITNLEAQEQNLVGLWGGTARDSFDKVFKSDKAQFDKFVALVENYCTALETESAEYTRRESENDSIARTRTY